MKATAEGDGQTPAEEMHKVRPCPFCGGEARLDVQYAFYGATGRLATPVMHVVGCLSCKIFMWDIGEDKLLERWNRRM